MALQLESSAEIIVDASGEKSVIARRDINAGEVLGENLNFPLPEPTIRWPVMTFEEATRLPSEERFYFMKFAVSIDLEGKVSGPLRENDVGEMSSYINHSCDPNCWWGLEGDTLEARRDIKAGDPSRTLEAFIIFISFISPNEIRMVVLVL